MFESPQEFKGKRIKLFKKEEIGLEEIFWDKIAKERNDRLGLPEQKLETPIFREKPSGYLFLFFLITFILFFRTFQLQIIEGRYFSRLSQTNQFIIEKIEAQRGIIYDQNFQQLVFNRPSFDLVLDKGKLTQSEKERTKILREISRILKIDLKELESKIAENRERKLVIYPSLSKELLINLEIRAEEFPGFEISQNSIREYWQGENFSHLLGYLSKIEAEELRNNPDFYFPQDYVGREGIEKFYEEVFRRNPGKIKIERDAQNNILSQEIVSLPQSGKSLVLWLDSALQKKIKEGLEKRMKETKATGGAAVVLDPKRGGIFSLLSLPSFDNNLFQKGSKEEIKNLLKDQIKPLFNRVTAGQYLVGSTIKPFIALAALEEKIISPEKKIYSNGFIEIPHRYNPKVTYYFKDWAVHGWTDIRKAIAQSVNVYFYTIGGGYKDQPGLGPTKIKEYLELFGFGQIPKIDLPLNEYAKGLVPDPQWKKNNIGENWWDGDTYNLSIGQGYILATPLQLAIAYSALINGGELLAPKVVQKIVDQDKNLVEEIPKEVLRQLKFDQKNIQAVKEGMRQAVTGKNSPLASALLLNDLPVSAAAKTGTAQVFRKNCPDCYNIWISVFAPYEEPEILMVLLLENVRGLPASQVIVPLAKEVLLWYFQQKSKN